MWRPISRSRGGSCARARAWACPTWPSAPRRRTLWASARASPPTGKRTYLVVSKKASSLIHNALRLPPARREIMPRWTASIRQAQ
eukprot:8379133-Pyramimonas_sp.AAC.1